MLGGDPFFTAIAYSSLAAAVSALGALPFAGNRSVPLSWVGSAYALASGLMLGAGYLLLSEGLLTNSLLTLGGSGLGVLYTVWTQFYSGSDRLETSPENLGGPDYGYKVILQNTLHSASEGVAIGVAMVLNLNLGIFLAVALAVHNVGEAMALTEILKQRGMRVSEAAGMCIVTNVSQVLLAAVALALGPVMGGWFPVAIGFASGAMLYLVLTELLPASYQRAGKPRIAFLVSSAAGVVVFLEGFLV